MPGSVPTVKTIKNNFTAGELSPRLAGRTDLKGYFNGVSILENFQVFPQGGVYRRPGTRFVAQAKLAQDTHLFPFIFSTVQAYIIEAGNLYFRFYKNGAQILSGGNPVELVTPYVQADIPAIKIAQSADTMYLAHSTYAPQKLTRTSDTAWTITPIAFIDGPYRDENTDANALLTVNNNAVGAGATMTASGSLTFNANQVGALWRVKGNTTYGYVLITAYTDATHVTVTVKTALDFANPGVTTTSLWREGAWSTYRGFPGSVTINAQRLIWAGNTAEPQRIWASRSNSYENHTPGTTDSDAWVYQIGSTTVDIIRWLSPVSRGLMIGTGGSEFLARGTSTFGDITPTSVDIHPHTTYGSSIVQPVRLSHLTYFVQRAGAKIRELSYQFASDTFVAPDKTIMSEHITGKVGIHTMSYQQDPNSNLFVLREDGTLATMTVYPEQDVYAWARIVTGGYAGDALEPIDHVATIPSPDGLSDQTWISVNRTVNGSSIWYIEYFDPTLNTDSASTLDNTQKTAALTPGATTGNGITFTSAPGVFTAGNVGSYIVTLPVGNTAPAGGTYGKGRAIIRTYTNATTVTADIVDDFPSVASIPANHWGIGVTTFSGLTPLALRQVHLIGDGSVYNPVPPSGVATPTLTVTVGGTLTIPVGMPPIVVTEIGIPYTSTLVTMRPELSSGAQTIGMEKKRYGWVRIRCDTTTTLHVGDNNTGTLYEFSTRAPNNPLGIAPATLTGDFDLRGSITGWNYDAQLKIQQPNPSPTIIHAIMGRLELGGDGE